MGGLLRPVAGITRAEDDDVGLVAELDAAGRLVSVDERFGGAEAPFLAGDALVEDFS